MGGGAQILNFYSPFAGTTSRILECGGPSIMVHKVADIFCSITHFPAFWQGIFLKDSADKLKTNLLNLNKIENND